MTQSKTQPGRLANQMSFYAAYHENRWNKLTHFFGVPVIIFSILIPLGWLRVSLGSFQLSLAMLFVTGVLIYYYLLDVPLALAMTAEAAILLYLSDRVAQLPISQGVVVFIVAFGGGWIVQLIGHAIEGRRPALMDNFFQIFVAPIFLMAELFFALGHKRDIEQRVQELAQRYK